MLLALRRPHSARELFGHNAAGTGAPRLLSWSHMHRTLDAESREKEMTLGHSGSSAKTGLPCTLSGGEFKLAFMGSKVYS